MRLRTDLPSANNFRRAERHVIHEWSAWRLVRGNFVAPDGDEFVRTYVESPGAACIVAFDKGSRGVVEVDRHGPEEKVMTIERYSLDEALAMIDRGEIDNAMAVVGTMHGLRFVGVYP